MRAFSTLCLLAVLLPVTFAKRMIVCEGYIGLLMCPADTMILVDVITIGATDDRAFCTAGDKLEGVMSGEEMQDLDALPQYQGLRVSEVCNNRRHCSVDATRIREPIGPKYTYLHIKYDCKPVSEVCINEHGRDADCDNWSHGDWAKEKGSECFNNPWWMSKNCFKSCTGCHAECLNYDDNDARCDLRAMFGHCEGSSSELSGQCERSCQTCPKKGEDACVNKRGDKDCNDWAEKGDCESSPFFMVRNCRKACKMCYKKCKDVWGDRYCTREAAAGKCDSDSAFMWKACAKSCGLCPKTMDECVNQDGDAKCLDLASKGECWKDPINMYVKCKKACLCHDGSECFNHDLYDIECERKKERGFCELSPGWAYYLCRRTCGMC